jgi:hypothetical protein
MIEGAPERPFGVQMVGWLCARPRPLVEEVLPPPPLDEPKLALPPPVSLMPRLRLLERLGFEDVPERPVVVRLAVSSWPN